MTLHVLLLVGCDLTVSSFLRQEANRFNRRLSIDEAIQSLLCKLSQGNINVCHAAIMLDELDPSWVSRHAIETKGADLVVTLSEFFELGNSLGLISESQVVLLNFLSLHVLNQSEVSGLLLRCIKAHVDWLGWFNRRPTKVVAPHSFAEHLLADFALHTSTTTDGTSLFDVEQGFNGDILIDVVSF